MPTESFIAELPKRLSLLATAMLIVSISYDFFFFLALGLSLSDVPTSLADHSRSAVIWAPVLLLNSAIGFLAGISSPVSNGSSPSLLGKFKKWEILLALINLPILLFLVLYSNLLLAVLILALVSVGLCLRALPGGANVDARLGPGSANQIYYFIAVLILAGLAGYATAHFSTLRPSKAIQVVVKHDSGEKVVPAALVRRFSSFLISSGKEGVTLWPNEFILRVHYPPNKNETIGCLIDARFCLVEIK
jgi:hypothetical protein